MSNKGDYGVQFMPITVPIKRDMDTLLGNMSKALPTGNEFVNIDIDSHANNNKDDESVIFVVQNKRVIKIIDDLEDLPKIIRE